jgi:hypothetical protein
LDEREGSDDDDARCERRDAAGLVVRRCRSKSADGRVLQQERADTDVPIAQGREVYAASTSPRKRFVEAPGLTHDQIVNAPDSRAAVKAFVTTLTR